MNKDKILSQKQIESRIFTIRGLQVMLDSDLAEMYCVTTGRLNEQVKRNIDRFPDDFMFRLTQKEWDSLISQNATSSAHGGRRKLPFVFTEQGVSGLSGILKSAVATKVHVAIMRTFVEMRKFIINHSGLLQRMDSIEHKQLETDLKFERIFKALENKNEIPKQGVFFSSEHEAQENNYRPCGHCMKTAYKNWKNGFI